MAYDKTIRFGSKATKSGEYITYGNKKMSIPLFNLPAWSTCPGKTPLCKKHCYAKVAEQLFPAVAEKRKRSLKLSKGKDFVAKVIEGLNGTLIPYVRIHESGDFYSQEYLEKWYEIVKAFPDRVFLAFTKNFKLDYSKAPANLKLYYSVFPDTDMSTVPAGRRAYTTVTFKSFTGVNPDVSKAEKCKGNCDFCLLCFFGKKDVYFPIHGRGIKSAH